MPGVAALLAARAAAGDDVVYVTNNSMWYRAEYVERIAGMGAPVSADRIVNYVRTTAIGEPECQMPTSRCPFVLMMTGAFWPPTVRQ